MLGLPLLGRMAPQKSSPHGPWVAWPYRKRPLGPTEKQSPGRIVAAALRFPEADYEAVLGYKIPKSLAAEARPQTATKGRGASYIVKCDNGAQLQILCTSRAFYVLRFAEGCEPSSEKPKRSFAWAKFGGVAKCWADVVTYSGAVFRST